MAGRSVGVFLAGFVVGVVVLVGWAALYLKFGHPPVATADPSFPMEAQIVHVPLDARIAKEMKAPPFTPDEASLQSGATIYVRQCSNCHGTPGHDVPYAAWMFPRTPQLWKKHGNSNVVGVSDDEAGETYWKVANGIRLSGMPAYQHILSEKEMWQISLLLKHADQPLSPAVMEILNGDVRAPGGATALVR